MIKAQFCLLPSSVIFWDLLWWRDYLLPARIAVPAYTCVCI